MVSLLEPMVCLTLGHSLLSYNYQEGASWSYEEVQAFSQGLLRYDKDFSKIAQEVSMGNISKFMQVELLRSNVRHYPVKLPLK